MTINRSLVALLAVSVLLVGRVQAAAPATEASKESKPAHHSSLKPEAKHTHKAHGCKHNHKVKAEKETENEAQEEKAEGNKS